MAVAHTVSASSESTSNTALLQPLDTFVRRHIGPTDSDVKAMLRSLGLSSLEALVDETIPAKIRSTETLQLRGHNTKDVGERSLLAQLRGLMQRNKVFRSYLGLGYADCVVPPVIQRNILENPGWYTQYTPYQAEISQGRLEALLNFQTMVADLTGLPLANASLLDEATAAAEAMQMAYALGRGKRRTFFVADSCHPQTIAVIKTRAMAVNITVSVAALEELDTTNPDLFGALVQYPTTYGRAEDYRELAEALHSNKAQFIVAADLLALTLLTPPGEFGADIAIGSAQRFGVPMGFGGPHAAFMSTTEANKRLMPGRIIGVSKDAQGKSAYRMAMQTREQHIRREKATSNICTAQALLAIMASMYGVYHGPTGLRRIAQKIHLLTSTLAAGLRKMGVDVDAGPYFDTLCVHVDDAQKVVRSGHAQQINLRAIDAQRVGISLDETTEPKDIETLWNVFATSTGTDDAGLDVATLAATSDTGFPEPLARRSDFMTHEVFNSYHAEHEMLRYINRLRSRDLSLTQSMIALGSCTMKLNATSEMLPVSWPEVNGLHPFAPDDQTEGYRAFLDSLGTWLCDITGFAAVSLQPNAGAQGEFAGLLAIRGYHHSRGDVQRDVCLIPVSAHGTNPASAVMAGMRVVAVACDDAGNVDLNDLRAKAEKHRDQLAALMITYPSTHGVFEEAVRDICDVVHQHGGQVYMDGANMNAQVGLCSPAGIGADVCHLNLHKTFCIPHGGGGPGMGPIGVGAHLAPFLPKHPLAKVSGSDVGAVAAAPFSSASILPISWMYIGMMGAEGLTKATQIAILNANYMAKRLEDHYPVLYRGARGRCAHEFIIDLRPFKNSCGIEAEDVAKRLMDYGFHAPTMSFPVAGTLMIEPTESETRAELDRFCDAMIAIRNEIKAIEEGRANPEDNPLKNAPHTAAMVTGDTWEHAYSRQEAAFPAPWIAENKFWPFSARIDNVWGDRNLICTCPSVAEMAED